jgi:signal peptidase I
MKHRKVIWLCVSCFAIPIFATIFYTYVRYLVVRIPSSNMLPSLYPGTIVDVDRWNSKPKDIYRGDIVAFWSPTNLHGEAKALYSGRVVGLPGETIQIKESSVFANGKKLGGLFAAISYEPAKHENEGSYFVPEGHFLILGDNPKSSFDSRFWGPLPTTNVVGKVVTVEYPRRPKFPDAQ